VAELGYKQELNRGWSGFSNFAIAHDHLHSERLLHDLRAGVELRRAVAISIGWPVISILVLLVDSRWPTRLEVSRRPAVSITGQYALAESAGRGSPVGSTCSARRDHRRR